MKRPDTPRLLRIHPRRPTLRLSVATPFSREQCSEKGDPEACRWLQEGLVWKAWMDGLAKVGLELGVGVGSQGLRWV